MRIQKIHNLLQDYIFFFLLHIQYIQGYSILIKLQLENSKLAVHYRRKSANLVKNQILDIYFFMFRFVFITMDYQQYKLSEAQDLQKPNLQSKDLVAFAAYMNLSHVFKKCTLRTYDYDLNLRQTKQFFANDKSQKSQSVISQHSKKQGQKSITGKSNLTKSGRPKIQTIKKQNMPLYHEPGNKIISKLQYPSSNALLGKQDSILPFQLAENSNIPYPSQANSLKTVEQNNSKLHFIHNDTFSQQLSPQHKQQHKQDVLPLMQKVDYNHASHMYVGEKARNIQALNQFLVKPSYKETSQFINNKMDQNFIEKSNKKQKTEGFRIALPQSLKKEKSQSEQFNTYKIVESRLFQEQVKHFNEQKSKSKSKTKLKQVKDTYIHTRKPKLKHPITEYTMHKESGLTPRKQTTSPQNNGSPHSKNPSKVNLQSKKEKNRQYQKQVLPIQDYDEVFDKQSEANNNVEDQSMSQCEENIKVILLPNSAKHNLSADYHYGNQQGQFGKHSKGSNADKPLQFFAIPLQKLKRHNQNKKYQVNQYQRQSQSQKKSQKFEQQLVTKKQVNEKSARKKIFSQTDKEMKEKSQTSTDVAEFTQEQMRMILGAKGNKYKEVIIKQYIRINRATQKQNNLG